MMDYFKRNLAPIPKEAWEEIDEKALEVISTQLHARKVLFVDGPHGLGKTSVPTGRLSVFKKGKQGTVGAGIYGVQPLMESRVEFTLSRWELDNILHGEKDVNTDNLEAAATAIAHYEEDAIYNGNKEANIKGLKDVAAHKMTLGTTPDDILKTVAKAVLKLQDAYAAPPYHMIVSDQLYQALSISHYGGLLRHSVENIIGGKIIRSHNLKGALLMPFNHEDLELTVGQDYAIGYETHDKDNVTFFITNAFTFRCLDADIVVSFDEAT